MIGINIHIFPDDETFSFKFDENKTFGDLKNDLVKKEKIKKGEYYIQMNDHVLNDEMVLKYHGVMNNCNLNIVKNEYVKINLMIKDFWNDIQTVENYMLVSDFKVIKPDKNKEINVCINNIYPYFVYMLFLFLLLFLLLLLLLFLLYVLLLY